MCWCEWRGLRAGRGSRPGERVHQHRPPAAHARPACLGGVSSGRCRARPPRVRRPGCDAAHAGRVVAIDGWANRLIEFCQHPDHHGHTERPNHTNPGRTPAFYQTDLSLNKKFSTPIDGLKVEFRTEFYNVFNWTQFSPPSTTADGGATFGTVTAQYNNPRLIQFSGRFTF